MPVLGKKIPSHVMRAQGHTLSAGQAASAEPSSGSAAAKDVVEQPAPAATSRSPEPPAAPPEPDPVPATPVESCSKFSMLLRTFRFWITYIQVVLEKCLSLKPCSSRIYLISVKTWHSAAVHRYCSCKASWWQKQCVYRPKGSVDAARTGAWAVLGSLPKYSDSNLQHP